MIPDILRNFPTSRYVDDDTPTGCVFVATTVVGISTTYIVRDDRILGRIEHHKDHARGYLGGTLKGGYYLGVGSVAELGQRIVTEFDEREARTP